MNLFDDIGSETIRQEYKEAVLSTETPNKEQFHQLFQTGRLSSKYQKLIEDQILHDLWRYIPKYISCFYNVKRKGYYHWFYGVTDNGIVTGIPILKTRIDRLRQKISVMVNHLMKNRLSIVIDRRDYQDHIKTCSCSHQMIYYRYQNKFLEGYHCSALTNLIPNIIRYYVIPLQIPSPEKLARPELQFITDIKKTIRRNIEEQEKYRQEYREWQIKLKKWHNMLDRFGRKIEIILNDDETRRQFEEYLKTEITEEDLCLYEGPDCYFVGGIGIKDPPFITIFREFREKNRKRIQPLRPPEPAEPKDKSFIYASRLAYCSYLSITDPNVIHVVLRMTLNGGKIPPQGRLVLLHNNHWHYVKRVLKPNNEPECR